MSNKVKAIISVLIFILFIFITGKSVNAQEFVQIRGLNFNDGDYMIVDVPDDMLANLTRYRFYKVNIPITEIDTSEGRWLEAANVYCVQHPNDIGSHYHVHSQYVIRMG